MAIVRSLAVMLALAPVAFADQAANPSPQFSPEEVAQIKEYWAEEGRYNQAEPEYAAVDGPYVVRQSVEGSRWLLDFFRMRTDDKVNPSQAPEARDAQEEAWSRWVEARIAYDHWQAGRRADAQNSEVTGFPVAIGDPPPIDPGPAPSNLVAAVGEVPGFADVVMPKQHVITFHDGTAIEYEDHRPMRRNFAYYRFHEGVQFFGQRVREMPESEIAHLFEQAGIDETAQRVMEAVSLLEGGFESVNTYDTGYVSVGFIQFACLPAGGHSLAQVLLTMKRDTPEAYQEMFRRYGIDASPDGYLVAVNPETGQEYKAAGAAHQIIQDKRLIAVFQRAGLLSEEFRVAQLRTAYEMYYPADDVITVTVGDRALSARIGDIFRTEAGMATLMDRKVNTGRMGNLEELLQEAVNTYSLNSLEEAAALEYDLTAALTYRKNYLGDQMLSQPRQVDILGSRGGERP